MGNLIIGAGLSGVNLAFHFLQRGEVITIADGLLSKSSSKIAAGLFNPVVFRNMKLSWKADAFLPSMRAHYQYLERVLGVTFYYELPIYKQLLNDGQINDWELAKEKSSISEYMAQLSIEEEQAFKVNSKINWGKVVGGGFLDVSAFLNAAIDFFKMEKCFIQQDVINVERVNAGFNVKLDNGNIVAANRIIDCSGVKAAEGVFNYLPFAPVKGEVLTVESNTFKYRGILSKNHWILPTAKNQQKIGATFNWKYEDELPSEEGLKELIEKANEIYPYHFQMVNHQAGLRPATRDRRPFLGEHPAKKRRFIFGGMGAKAVMMSPLLAELLVKHIVDGEKLWPEVDICRYYKFFKDE